MATVSQLLTASPAVLSGLDEGVWYSVQNRGNRHIYVQSASAVPTHAGQAKELFPEGHILSIGRVRKESGEEIYVWAKGSGAVSPGLLVYDKVG